MKARIIPCKWLRYIYMGLLAQVCISISGQSIRPSPNFPVTDGPVICSLLLSNTIFLGGSFQSVSPYCGTVAPVNATSGQLINKFPRISGPVSAVVGDGVGGWFIGGNFTFVEGLPLQNLVHVTASNSVDTTWEPVPDGAVQALAVSGNTLLVGGAFQHIANQPRSGLAAFAITNGSLKSFTADVQGQISCITTWSNKIVIGGEFSSVAITARTNLAILNAADLTVASFAPNPTTTDDSFSVINCLNVYSNTLYIGGVFTTVLGQSHTNIAAINLSSNLVSSWSVTPNDTVYAIAVGPQSVFFGGAFTMVGNSLRNYLVAVDPISASVQTWNPNISENPFFNGGDSFVDTLLLTNNTLYVGGNFGTISGQTRLYAAAVDANFATILAWNPRLNSAPNCFALQSSTVCIGGVFCAANGLLRYGACAIDIKTGNILNWNPDAEGGSVDAIAGFGTNIYLGGTFTTIGGTFCNGLASVDQQAGFSLGWLPAVSGTNGPLNGYLIDAIYPTTSRVFVGGLFNQAGGASNNNLAALDPASGNSLAWNASADGQVQVLTLSNNTLRRRQL